MKYIRNKHALWGGAPGGGGTAGVQRPHGALLQSKVTEAISDKWHLSRNSILLSPLGPLRAYPSPQSILILQFHSFTDIYPGIEGLLCTRQFSPHPTQPHEGGLVFVPCPSQPFQFSQPADPPSLSHALTVYDPPPTRPSTFHLLLCIRNFPNQHGTSNVALCHRAVARAG